MFYKEGSFKCIKDSEIYYQYWLPDNTKKAVILLIHGMAEHSGRYMNLVNHMIPKGYAIYGFDHIGCGKSSGKRSYIDQFKDFTDIIDVYYNMIKKWEPDLPIIILGHSMGGLITSNYLLDHQKNFQGAVLSGPPVKVPENLSYFSIIAGNIVSGIYPSIGLMKINPNDICSDKNVVQAYIDDPLVYKGGISARLLSELIKAMKRISNNSHQISLPLFIVHGGADKLAEPLGSQLLYEKAASTNKGIKIYDGLYHEVMNEPEHKQVLNDIESKIELFI